VAFKIPKNSHDREKNGYNIYMQKRRIISQKALPKTALEYVLEGLIPYTDANLKLSFKPSAFFYDLESISKNKKYKAKKTIQNAYYKAIKNGLIELGDNRLPTLTNAGKAKIKPFKPSLLDKNTVLMVIFDIPEDQRPKRDRLRAILKMLDFKLIQKSTWVAKTDCREYLAMEVRHNQLEDYVQIYEAKKLKI